MHNKASMLRTGCNSSRHFQDSYSRGKNLKSDHSQELISHFSLCQSPWKAHSEASMAETSEETTYPANSSHQIIQKNTKLTQPLLTISCLPRLVHFHSLSKFPEMIYHSTTQAGQSPFCALQFLMLKGSSRNSSCLARLQHRLTSNVQCKILLLSKWRRHGDRDASLPQARITQAPLNSVANQGISKAKRQSLVPLKVSAASTQAYTKVKWSNGFTVTLVQCYCVRFN